MNKEMKKTVLPENIKNMIGTQEYTIDSIGESGSEVRVYDQYVLKIQPHSQETDNEAAVIRWLNGRLPLPDIPVYAVENETAFTLMSKIRGKMLCDMDYLRQPELVIGLVAQGIKMMWQVDVSGCPCYTSRLSERLKAAEYNVKNGLVDIDNTEPETFGSGGFESPEALLEWLKSHRPPEDIVLTHGDFCLPNIFADGETISGLIDLGKMGPADRWQDIAIAIRSLDHNFDGRYFDGKRIFDFKPQMLLEALDMHFDEEKYRYYYLLDELF